MHPVFIFNKLLLGVLGSVADPVFFGHPDPDPDPQKGPYNSNFSRYIKLSIIQFRQNYFFLSLILSVIICLDFVRKCH